MQFKLSRGFSTLELMIAFALMSLVFSGVILAHFASAYWSVAAQTSNEGLYNAKTDIEQLRASVRKDFRLASSSPSAKISDADCIAGSLCYYITTTVADLSPCSKYVTAQVDWQVQGYPTTTTSLFTNLTDANEAINLGGDCPLTTPGGAWAAAVQSASFDKANLAAAGIDTLGGISYIASTQHPALAVADSAGMKTFANGFEPMDPYNAIDVVRDLSTGRTYGYAAVASTSVQLEILDLTDALNPISVSKVTLAGVDKNGSFPQGWRVAYYDRKIYIATLETTGPEFHVIDVSNPATPSEVGSFELNTSAYGIVVRNVKQGSIVHRLVFLATSDDSKELVVLDATTPGAITELTNVDTNLSGAADSRSIFFAGNTLYIGRISNSGAELYSLNASNIFGAVGGLPAISSIEVGGDATSIRVSDPYVFVATSKSSGQLQIFKTTGGTISTTPVTLAASGINSIDMEGNSIYAAGTTAPRLRVIQSQ